jgi:hypothetical protein
VLDHAIACVTKLAEIGYEGLAETVFSIFVRCGRNWSFSHFCNAVETHIARVFPKEYIGKLEDLYKTTENYDIGGSIKNLKEAYGVTPPP